ncbi:MAG: glycosyltransferase [Gemmatimonadetes bacterium]|nr:glycosyltransferase [Gemmatimonadota bacterium]
MMFAIVDVGLIAAGVFYFTFALWLLMGVRRSRRASAGKSTPCTSSAPATPSVSVIVAARNEAAHIACCLDALSAQDYEGSLEIIVVDDRSTDETATKVQDWVQRASQAGTSTRLISAPSPPLHQGPKKSALAGGIAASSGELLMFTDADCRPPSGWVTAMAACFDATGADLVAGYADRDAEGPLQRVLRLDESGMGALAEGGIGHGVAFSCTGRSLAYRRQLYDQVGGFDAIGHLISGDDVYFLRHVVAQAQARLGYCADPEAVVEEVRGRESWRSLMWQKLRHASKASRYRGGARLLGFAVYGYHILLAIGLWRAVTQGEWVIFGAVWGTRWLMDALLLGTFAPRAEDRWRLCYLPFAEFLYIPYVVLLVPLARIFGFRWRDTPAAPPQTSPSIQN